MARDREDGRSRQGAGDVEKTGVDSPVQRDRVPTRIRFRSVLLEKTPDPVAHGLRCFPEIIDESGQTTLPRVYAGGDIVLGAATVILAMGQGRRAAESINAMLAGKQP